MSHFFNKLWGKRRDPRPLKPKAKATLPDTTKEDRVRNAIIDAADRRRRQWEKYVEARKNRLRELAKTYPGVAAYRQTLRQLIKDPDAKWTGPRDTNVDLCDLAQECGLQTIERAYDRYLILEVSRDFISALGKREGVPPEVLVDDPAPLFAPPIETELSRLKCTLSL